MNFVRSAVAKSRKASLGISFWQRVSYTFRRTTCVQPVHDPPSDGTRATAATVNPLQVEQSLKIDYCRAAGIEWLQDRTAREPSKNPKTTAVYDGFFLKDVLAKSGGFRRSRFLDQHRVALLRRCGFGMMAIVGGGGGFHRISVHQLAASGRLEASAFRGADPRDEWCSCGI